MTEAPSLRLNRDQYLEFEKIGLGAFWPLQGFMNEGDFKSVVSDMRLLSGDVFSLPVLLDIEHSTAAEIRDAQTVDLTFEGQRVGHLEPRDFFKCDRPATAKLIYGTSDSRHPGVSHFYNLAPIFVGGKVELIRRATLDISDYELTPAETRQIFADRGWKRIVGFQTRNVPHRAHEYLQRTALETVDGLFIQPLVGRKRSGDFTPEAIIRGYRAMIEGFFPENRIVLGILSTVMRYAGPREAVFHAIVRRNYGCTHFIVGRDHAGVGDYYGLYDAHELTRQFDGDLGIDIFRLQGPYYCPDCDGIVTDKTCPHHGHETTRNISGTDMRRILVDGQKPDPKLMRAEIVAALEGIQLFIED